MDEVRLRSHAVNRLTAEQQHDIASLIMKGIEKFSSDRYRVKVYYKPAKGTLRISHNEHGKPITEAKEAIRVKRNIELQKEKGTFEPADYQPTTANRLHFEIAIKKWFDDNQHKYAPTTKKDIISQIERLFIPAVDKDGNYIFQKRDVRDIRAFHIDDFAVSIRGKAPKTRNNIMGTLRVFFKWLKRRNHILEIPVFPALEQFEDREPKPCPWDVFTKIIDEIPDETDRQALYTMRLEWLRTGELRALQARDFLWDEKPFPKIWIRRSFSDEVLRETTKTKKQRRIHLHSIVRRMLEDRIRNLPPKAFVFTKDGKPYSESWLRKQFEIARDKLNYSKELTLYGSTRHSSATDAYIETGDIRAVQKALGHSDIRTTMKYMHYDETSYIMEPSARVLPLKQKEGKNE